MATFVKLQTHRWKKRGISVIPLRYDFDQIPFFQYNVQVVIYKHDGSVAISHGAIEMGQGINTKVRFTSEEASVNNLKYRNPNILSILIF